MNYTYRVIIFLVLAVLFMGCESQDKNNENKPKINSKEHSSSQSCFADTRAVFENKNAPVFESSSSVDVYEGKKNVFAVVAKPNSTGTISYSICGRGSEFFNIGSSNGKITFKDGITSDNTNRSSYKVIVKATDSGDNKSTSQIFTITILDTVAPNIQDIGAKTFTLNSAITPTEFVNIGGAIASCSVTPSLPNNLKVELSSTTDNCVLSGTPTESSSSAEYNITASNSIGENNATINITTLQSAPVISDTILSTIFTTQSVGLSYIKDVLSEEWKFSNTGGAIASCEINSTLPDGLSFNTTTCVITGTPTSEIDDWYTITGENSGGMKSNVLKIHIHVKKNDLSIDNISVNQELIVDKDLTSSMQFGNGDGTPKNMIKYCAISPELPSGLILSVNNEKCEISGTPRETKVSTPYTVTAMSDISGGSATVTIVVNSPLLAPNIANAGDKTFTLGTAITPFNFTNTGGTIASCDINKSLSAGLSFNATTCEITGTPTGNAVDETTYTSEIPTGNTVDETTYTITAKNATGENNATVKITVNEVSYERPGEVE